MLLIVPTQICSMAITYADVPALRSRSLTVLQLVFRKCPVKPNNFTVADWRSHRNLNLWGPFGFCGIIKSY